MSSSTSEARTENIERDVPRNRPPRRRWRLFIVPLVLILVVAAGIAVATGHLRLWGTTKQASPTSDVPVSTATVQKRTLISQTFVNGTLQFAGAYEVINHGTGTYTKLPDVGAQISQGDELYQIDGKPVYLMYGSTPLYRDLSKSMKGDDVRELNAELVALGYASKSVLDPNSNTFGTATYDAMIKLQKKLGLDQTGTLPVSQAVFLPVDAILVSKVTGVVGGAAQPGPVIDATSTARMVSVDLDTAQLSLIKVGDAVTITLPNLKNTAGTVSAIGRIATKHDSGSPTINVSIQLSNPTDSGQLDQAPVQVAIVSSRLPDALAVPVNALLAEANGGFAVEVVQSDNTRKLYPVTLGMFDDSAGIVQIISDQVQAGQKIVVPNQ